MADNSRRQENSDNENSVVSASDVVRRVQTNPASLTPANVLSLQRTIGNQAVMRLIARKEAGSGFTAVKHVQKPNSPSLSTGSTIQRWNRFESQDLPPGGHSGFATLRDVHFSYISDRRASHTQLHITFSDSDTPEAGETRASSRFLWYNTQTRTWTAVGAKPCDDVTDIAWYKAEALTWGTAKETEYLQTIPAHARPLNEFTYQPAAPVVVVAPPPVVVPPPDDDGFTVVKKGGKPK